MNARKGAVVILSLLAHTRAEVKTRIQQRLNGRSSQLHAGALLSRLMQEQECKGIPCLVRQQLLECCGSILGSVSQTQQEQIIRSLPALSSGEEAFRSQPFAHCSSFVETLLASHFHIARVAKMSWWDLPCVLIETQPPNQAM